MISNENIEGISIDIAARELLEKLSAKGLKYIITTEDDNLVIKEEKEETFEEFQKRLNEIAKKNKPDLDTQEWLEIIDDM